jgi:hypothetical protein
MPLRFLSDGRRADLPLSHIHSQRFELTLSLTPPDTDTDAAASTGSDAAPSQPANQAAHKQDSKCVACPVYARFRTFRRTSCNIVATTRGQGTILCASGTPSGRDDPWGAGHKSSRSKKSGPGFPMLKPWSWC